MLLFRPLQAPLQVKGACLCVCDDCRVFVVRQTYDAVQFFLCPDDRCDLDGPPQKTYISGRKRHFYKTPGSRAKGSVCILSFCDDPLKMLNTDVARRLVLCLRPSECIAVRPPKCKPLPRRFGWIAPGGTDGVGKSFAYVIASVPYLIPMALP